MKYQMEDPRYPFRGGWEWRKLRLGVNISGRFSKDAPFELKIPGTVWEEIISAVPTTGVADDEYRWKPNGHTLLVVRRQAFVRERFKVFLGLGMNGTGMTVEISPQVWADILDFMALEVKAEPVSRFQLLTDTE